ncbi:MAG: LacI family transcriptional regulator [Cocleimonas sp.]|jgi:LacI family transcriptional regulator
MMENKSPTIADVAQQAEVSTATVSRCLNQPDKVKPEVRERISKAIKDLDYVPSGAARALASRRTYTIGAVVPTIDNAIFSETIQHLQSGLTQANYTLLLANSGYSLDEELREVRSLLSRGIDGIVLVGEMHRPEVFAAIEQQKIPYVNLWTYNPDSQYSCIGFDHIKAGNHLAEHLIDLNHKEFGIISGFQEDNDRALLRYRGIRQSLERAGLNIPESRIIQCRYSVEQANISLHQLLDKHPEITAVVCGNDVLAIGALSAARERNISVPEQLSITGFDNMEIIPFLSPALTTVNAPSRRMGSHAAEYILKQIENKSLDVERLELNAELIIRDTTGQAQK